MKSIIIAAPHSGSGKTTITVGIMECFRRRGLTVAPFKVGPDFIDPGYHRLVTGLPSANLDGWICPPEFVRASFAHHALNADMAIIEGVMGLFDGFGGIADEGSTAQVARLTGAPVILVVDARGLARSAAAILKGFAEFDPSVRVAGVIFNNVAGDSHERILREAVAQALPELKVFGCIPRDDGLHIPARHLGLFTAEEHPLSDEFLDHLVEVIRDRVDLGLLWGAANPLDAPVPRAEPIPCRTLAGPVRLAVARDEAFCFVYEDNLCLLRRAGAEIVTFSPLRDERLPDDVAGVYLPGGYPEVFADALAANNRMKESLARAVDEGMPVYAECGGFIYLTRGVTDGAGEPESLHEFVGIFPVTTRMLPRRKALGYREVELAVDTIIGPAGTQARGHEFHYSEMEEMPADVERAYRVRRGPVDLGMEGYLYRNCLASYVHLHFGSNPELAASFVARCRSYATRSSA